MRAPRVSFCPRHSGEGTVSILMCPYQRQCWRHTCPVLLAALLTRALRVTAVGCLSQGYGRARRWTSWRWPFKPFFFWVLETMPSVQVDFLTLAFSSKSPERLAPSMARVHAHLIREQGLNEQHFDMVAGHLGDALGGAGWAAARAGPSRRCAHAQRTWHVRCFWRGFRAALHELAQTLVHPCPSSFEAHAWASALSPWRAGACSSWPGLACALGALNTSSQHACIVT